MTERDGLAWIETWHCLQPLAAAVAMFAAVFVFAQAPRVCVHIPADAACVEYWIERYQALIGAAATLFAGYLAYRGAMITGLIAEREARAARYENANARFSGLAAEIDLLSTARGYAGATRRRSGAGRQATVVFACGGPRRSLVAAWTPLPVRRTTNGSASSGS